MNDLLQIGLANAAIVTVMAIPAYALSRWGKRPAMAHLLWVIVLIKLLTPPIWQIPVKWNRPVPEIASDTPNSIAHPINEALEISALEITANNSEPVTPEPALVAEPSFEAATSFSWRTVLATVWICGSLVIGLVTLRRTLSFVRCLRRVSPAPRPIQELIEGLGHKLGLRSTPLLSITPMRMPPLVWGRGRHARIVVPATLWNELDADQRSTLLVHELAHLRRGDQWVRLLETTARTVYWWHPVVWIASHELREAEEQCCDAWAVWALPGAAKSYARALVDTVDFLTESSKPLPAGASGIGQVQDLKRRLIMIMRGTTPRKLSPTSLTGLVALGGLAVVFSPGIVQQRSTAETNAVDDPTHLVSQIADDSQEAKAEIARLKQQEASLRQALDALSRSLDQTRSQLRDVQSDQPRTTRPSTQNRPVPLDEAGYTPLTRPMPLRSSNTPPARATIAPIAHDEAATAPVPPTPARVRSINPPSPDAINGPAAPPAPARVRSINPPAHDEAAIAPVPPRVRSTNTQPSNTKPRGAHPQVEDRIGRLEDQLSQIANDIQALRREMRPGRYRTPTPAEQPEIQDGPPVESDPSLPRHTVPPTQPRLRYPTPARSANPAIPPSVAAPSELSVPAVDAVPLPPDPVAPPADVASPVNAPRRQSQPARPPDPVAPRDAAAPAEYPLPSASNVPPSPVAPAAPAIPAEVASPVEATTPVPPTAPSRSTRPARAPGKTPSPSTSPVAPPATPRPGAPVPASTPPQPTDDPTQRMVTDKLVENFVLKDANVKGYLNEIDRADQYLAKLRIIADKPEALPEFQEYVAIVKELNQKLAKRKNELRPLIQKRLEEVLSKNSGR
ncbi:hypothetical protein BH10PLA2_BH10PLA2_02870 [soil metagenome]